MSIDIPPEFAEFLEQELATGQYDSASDVVCQGLRLLKDHKKRLEELRSAIRVGEDQIARGESIEINDEHELKAFFDDIQQRGQARWANKQAET
jgi:antitoxin ParD1/3/4